MKRIYFLIMLCVLASISYSAITEYYDAPVASTGTYAAITGTVAGIAGDEELTDALPLGFTFNYCGTAYTQVKMSSNGYLAVGSAHNWFYSYENFLNSTSSEYYPFIAPLWDDLNMDAGSVRYEQSGSAPNRIFTAQWANARWDWNGTPGQNFQVKLYETSDKIEFIYGTMITPANDSGGATIGINMAPGGSGNFWSITPGTPISSSTTVEYNSFANIALLPSGTTYTFNKAVIVTPPNPALVVYPGDGATLIPTGTNLSWANGGNLPTGYRLYFGTDGGGSTTPINIVNDMDLGANLTFNPTNDLAANTPHYWQVIPYNDNGPATGCPIWSFTTADLPLRGIKTIDPAGSGPDNYLTFTAAINALNAQGVGQDGVTFNVAGVTFNETAMLPVIVTAGTEANPIVFQSAGGRLNPLVTAPGTTGTEDYIFKIVSGDYMTFDGIDVANATGLTSIEYGYWFAEASGDGCNNNVVKNCTVTLDRANANSIGIYSQPTSAPSNFNLFQDNTVNTANIGIWLGPVYPATITSELNVVEGNIINSCKTEHLDFQYQDLLSVFDNVINFPTTTPNATTVYGINTYGITNAQIYSNTLAGGNITGTIYGMMFNQASGLEIHHNTITDISTAGLYKSIIGIWVNMATTGTGLTSVHHNDFYDLHSASGYIWTIYTFRCYELHINNNNIYDIEADVSFWGVHSIENTSMAYISNIYNNKIYNVTLTGETIQISSCINAQDRWVRIFNNMVYNIKAPVTTLSAVNEPQICGISLKDMQAGQSEQAEVYNNSVLLDGSGSDNFTTACFYSNFGGPVDLKNNIFVNKSNPGTTGKAIAFWRGAPSGWATPGVVFENFDASMDKNIYYAGTPGAQHLIFKSATNDCQTLAEYKTLNVGKDQGSYTENVPFLSSVLPYDLHIDPIVETVVEGNGVYIPLVVIDDIDGDVRSVTPDIGADEGVFTPGFFPDPPINITIIRVGNDLEITWDAVTDATGYHIYGSDEPYGSLPWTLITTVMAPTTNVVINNPPAPFKFYYVTAY